MISRILLAALPLLASAAPAPETDFLHTLAKRASGPEAIAKLSQCDISAIKMNPLGLPPPSEGLVLDHIALGRGTQNYTCVDDTDASKPVAAGAVAILFNVTCMAGPYAGLLDALPAIAMKYPIPTPEMILSSTASPFYLGNHYFVGNATVPDKPVTPFFNLNTQDAPYGMVGLALQTSNDAKTDPASNVKNLKLSQKNRDGCRVQEVYRLNSAGGQPPKSCKGMPKTFEVQYATEYWFWSDPAGNMRTGTYSA